MSTIEDKILDGPRIHYCDADDDDVRVDGNDGPPGANEPQSLFTRPDQSQRRCQSTKDKNSCSKNTGPKGVIEDFKKQESRIDGLDEEFQSLLNDDSILEEYISKRMTESRNKSAPTFGQVFHLKNGPELLDSIDKETPNVMVIVHIYTRHSRSCSNLDRCLVQLAKEFEHIKFLTSDANVVGLSSNFKENGVPALLAYKGGNLIKSLVQLEDLLDRDFDVCQVRELLLDNGLL